VKDFILSTLHNATPIVPKLKELLETFLQELSGVFEKFGSIPPTPEITFDFETQLDGCCRENCRRLVEHQYNRVEPAEFEDTPVRMRLDREEYKRRRKSPNTIATLFGEITLSRYVYEAIEPGEPCIFPLEMRLGVEAGLATPALAERIGRYSADQSQENVLNWLEHEHGVKWSPTSLRKLQSSLRSGLCSFREQAQVEKILELLRKAEKSKGSHRPVLAAGRDGIFLPMRRVDGPLEGSTATVSVMDRRGKRLGTVYLGQMPEPGQGTLSDQLTSLLLAVLKQWDGCRLRLAYITDCGTHPKQYYEEVLKKMKDPKNPSQLLEWQWIADFWHACGYLNKMREGLFGNTGAGWRWYKKMRHWLRHRKHGVVEVLRSATQHWIRCDNPTDERKALFEEGYGYIRKYARRMAYSRYRRQGLPIGSGVTEAACKTVFTQRLKQSGMTWKMEGGQVIVDLRVIKLSGVWSSTYRLYQQSRPLPKPVDVRGSYQRSQREILKIAA
jgi:hypothetical protein